MCDDFQYRALGEEPFTPPPWQVKYKETERGPWIEMPLVGGTSQDAWRAWAWAGITDYHTVMVYDSRSGS